MRCLKNLRIVLYYASVFPFLLGGCTSSGEILQQCNSLVQFSKLIAPSFSSYFMRTIIDGKNRIDIYVQMPYKKLRFIKSGTGYRAFYSYSILIRDEKNNIAQSREIERIVECVSYEETVSARSDYYLERIQLEPGKYNVEVLSQDNLSTLKYRYKEGFTAPLIDTATISASTLLLLNTVVYDGSGLSLRPILPYQISALRDSVGFFQEIYNSKPGDSIVVSHEYYTFDSVTTSEDRFTYRTPPYRMNDFPCRTQQSVRYYHNDTVIVPKNYQTIQFVKFYPVPKPGSSTIKRTIFKTNGSRRDSLESFLKIFKRDFRYQVYPSTEEVVSAMRYILREKEYDSLLTGNTEEQIRRIDRIWENKGGSQRKNEFEQRIHEANSLFSSCLDGSKTAMGIVYIICGNPDYIDCHGTNVENWYYTIGERTFVAQFRQIRKNTDQPYYQLEPFSLNESFWQYHVDRWRRKK